MPQCLPAEDIGGEQDFIHFTSRPILYEIVDRKGELVGLVFDSNLDGLGGRFGYTEQKARAILVDPRGVMEALTRVYRASHIADELSP